MTKEYALHLLNQLSIGASVDAKPIILQYELAQALNLAIKALEQQPCDDATLKDIFCMGCEYKEQQPKTGKWIEQQDIHKHHYGWLYCSECGAFLISSDGANFCSCCGAKMEESEDEE